MQPSAPRSPATKAGVSSLRLATTVTFSGSPAKASAARFAAQPVRAGRARRRMTGLAHSLVRHAAGVDDSDVGSSLRVAVGEQRFANLVGIGMRDLAAQKAHGEAGHRPGCYSAAS